MLWRTQSLIDHHVNVRMVTHLDEQFDKINELVSKNWHIFASRNTRKDEHDNYKLIPPPERKPRIVTACNRYGDLLIPGVRHACDFMMGKVVELGGLLLLRDYSELECLGELKGTEQGFVDQYGIFYDRKEAMKIAIANNQVIHDIGYKGDELFTEHLY